MELSRIHGYIILAAIVVVQCVLLTYYKTWLEFLRMCGVIALIFVCGFVLWFADMLISRG